MIDIVVVVCIDGLGGYDRVAGCALHDERLRRLVGQRKRWG